MYNIQAPAKYPVHFQVNIVFSAANVQKVAASRVLIPVLMCGSPTKNGLGNGNTIINHTIISYIIIFLIPWKWKDAFFSNTTWHTIATAEQEILWLIHWMFLSPPDHHHHPGGMGGMRQWPKMPHNDMINHGVINETSSNINETPWHSQLFTLKNAKKKTTELGEKNLCWFNMAMGNPPFIAFFFSSKTLVDV